MSMKSQLFISLITDKVEHISIHSLALISLKGINFILLRNFMLVVHKMRGGYIFFQVNWFTAGDVPGSAKIRGASPLDTKPSLL